MADPDKPSQREGRVEVEHVGEGVSGLNDAKRGSGGMLVRKAGVGGPGLGLAVTMDLSNDGLLVEKSSVPSEDSRTQAGARVTPALKIGWSVYQKSFGLAV